MDFKCFSFALGLSAGIAAASPATWVAAAPLPAGPAPFAADIGAVTLAQIFKERDLPALPPVDTGREQPPAARTSPPAPPPVPPPPRLTSRTPPAATTTDDESGPPPREVPPPPSRTSRASPAPPMRLHDPAPMYRPPPRADEPPQPAVAVPPRIAPPAYGDPAPRRAAPRSSFAVNCTAQCHLSCEASFEACNGDASPAKPACVKKLEACRIERCSCVMR